MFTLTLERNVPTYTYTCTACNEMIEKRQSFSDPPLTTCEQCGGALRKVIHPVGIVFKGSGWYITDSRSSSSTSSASSAPESRSSSDSKDGKDSKDSKGASKSSDGGSSKDSGSTTSKESSASGTPAKES